MVSELPKYLTKILGPKWPFILEEIMPEFWRNWRLTCWISETNISAKTKMARKPNVRLKTMLHRQLSTKCHRIALDDRCRGKVPSKFCRQPKKLRTKPGRDVPAWLLSTHRWSVDCPHRASFTWPKESVPATTRYYRSSYDVMHIFYLPLLLFVHIQLLSLHVRPHPWDILSALLHLLHFCISDISLRKAWIRVSWNNCDSVTPSIHKYYLKEHILFIFQVACNHCDDSYNADEYERHMLQHYRPSLLQMIGNVALLYRL